MDLSQLDFVLLVRRIGRQISQVDGSDTPAAHAHTNFITILWSITVPEATE